MAAQKNTEESVTPYKRRSRDEKKLKKLRSKLKKINKTHEKLKKDLTKHALKGFAADLTHKEMNLTKKLMKNQVKRHTCQQQIIELEVKIKSDRTRANE